MDLLNNTISTPDLAWSHLIKKKTFRCNVKSYLEAKLNVVTYFPIKTIALVEVGIYTFRSNGSIILIISETTFRKNIEFIVI